MKAMLLSPSQSHLNEGELRTEDGGSTEKIHGHMDKILDVDFTAASYNLFVAVLQQVLFLWAGKVLIIKTKRGR